MALTCQTPTNRDAISVRLCEQMTRGGTISPSHLDRGVQRIDYHRSGAMPRTGSPDGKLDPVEIYQSFLEMDLPQDVAPQAHALFKSRFGTGKPWIVDERHEPTVQHFLQRVESRARQITQQHAQISSCFARADALLQMLFEPKSKGGLGLRYQNHLLPELDINGAMDRGIVRCSEFQMLYYALARRMGLQVQPLHTFAPPSSAGARRDQPHAAILITDDVHGRRYFADAAFPLLERVSPYTEYHVGTAADMFAGYLYNTSMVSNGTTMEMRTSPCIPLQQVEAIAPFNALALFGLGEYYKAAGLGPRALASFQKATEIWPNYAAAWNNRCFLTLDEDICQHASTLSSQPPPQ